MNHMVKGDHKFLIDFKTNQRQCLVQNLFIIKHRTFAQALAMRKNVLNCALFCQAKGNLQGKHENLFLRILQNILESALILK